MVLAAKLWSMGTPIRALRPLLVSIVVAKEDVRDTEHCHFHRIQLINASKRCVIATSSTYRYNISLEPSSEANVWCIARQALRVSGNDSAI